jgi:hypothetical protein
MDILKLIEQLELAEPDRVNTTRELSPYEQGWQNGRIDLIRYIKQLLEDKEE